MAVIVLTTPYIRSVRRHVNPETQLHTTSSKANLPAQDLDSGVQPYDSTAGIRTKLHTPTTAEQEKTRGAKP